MISGQKKAEKTIPRLGNPKNIIPRPGNPKENISEAWNSPKKIPRPRDPKTNCFRGLEIPPQNIFEDQKSEKQLFPRPPLGPWGIPGGAPAPPELPGIKI